MASRDISAEELITRAFLWTMFYVVMTIAGFALAPRLF